MSSSSPLIFQSKDVSHHILTFLDPICRISTRRTCKVFNLLKLKSDDECVEQMKREFRLFIDHKCMSHFYFYNCACHYRQVIDMCSKHNLPFYFQLLEKSSSVISRKDFYEVIKDYLPFVAEFYKCNEFI